MLIGPRCGPIAFVTFRSCARMWFQATRRQHGGQPPRPSQRKSLAERRRSETRFGLLRFTKPRIGGIADASGSRRRKRPELGQPRLAQPAQRRLVRPGQRRQDHSDGTVRTRCDESPARSRPRQQLHRWRRVRTGLRPRRPTWFSRTSETSRTSFCWTNVGFIHPGNHTDMAVNPAQPRVHEPDNSMAPKWRAALPGTGGRCHPAPERRIASLRGG
jgi:hypothetical protein